MNEFKLGTFTFEFGHQPSIVEFGICRNGTRWFDVAFDRATDDCVEVGLDICDDIAFVYLTLPGIVYTNVMVGLPKPTGIRSEYMVRWFDRRVWWNLGLSPNLFTHKDPSWQRGALSPSEKLLGARVRERTKKLWTHHVPIVVRNARYDVKLSLIEHKLGFERAPWLSPDVFYSYEAILPQGRYGEDVFVTMPQATQVPYRVVFEEVTNFLVRKITDVEAAV